MNLTKAILLEFIQSELEEIIRKSGDKYCLYSKKKNPKTGKRRNLGCYPSRDSADNRSEAVQANQQAIAQGGQIITSLAADPAGAKEET
jgi:hypothetical protein